jgi:ABC-type bacteriocin/lantibiotic exporter with double-glycine peptidase domain
MSLRNQISVVLQESMLFHTTIAENFVTESSMLPMRS